MPTSPSPSPFSWSALQKDILPILLFGMVTLTVSFAEAGQAYDRHWTTAWLITIAVSVAFAWGRTLRLSHPAFWGLGMALLIVQGIRGGCERWEVLAMWGWLWT